MHFIITVLIILLAGCASTVTGNHYAQAVQSWRGGKIGALAQRWGRPDQQLTSPIGNTVFVYKTARYRAYGSASAPIAVDFRSSGKPVIVSIPNNAWNRGPLSENCITVFEANKQGIIIDTQMGGNGCYGNASFANERGNIG